VTLSVHPLAHFLVEDVLILFAALLISASLNFLLPLEFAVINRRTFGAVALNVLSHSIAAGAAIKPPYTQLTSEFAPSRFAP